MIIHGNRFTIKPDASPELLKEALESLRNQGRVIPSVRSFVVGRDHGGEYEWGATFEIEDLDGYWEYLTHPAHQNTDRIGLPLVDKFMSFDITDDLDPEMGAKIAALHQRRYDSDAHLTQLVSDLGEYTGSAAPGPHGESRPAAQPQTPEELVTAWAAIWNGDLSLTDRTVHQDFVSHAAPLLGGPSADAQGRENLSTWVSGIRAALPDLEFTIQVGPVVDGPFVTVRWHAEGTYAGGIPGTAPEAVGRRIVFDGTDTLRIADGLLAEYWANADSLWAAQQLGLAPAAG